jgi:hypothetical protein
MTAPTTAPAPPQSPEPPTTPPPVHPTRAPVASEAVRWSLPIPGHDHTERAFRVLVTGWRNWPHLFRFVIDLELSKVTHHYPAASYVVVHGQCPHGGVDKYADAWAQSVKMATPEPHPADWASHGKGAGMIRNGEMVAAGADLCLAFPGPGSRGTWDCMRRAVEAGIPLRTVSWSPVSAARWAERAGIAGPWITGGRSCG